MPDKRKRVSKKRKALSEAEAKRIEGNLDSVCKLLAGLHPSLSPDALSHLLDRCSLAVEELSGVQAMVLQDAGQAVDTVDKITSHLDKMNLLLRHTEEMADYVRKKRQEVDNLEKTHFPEGLSAIEK